MNDSQILSNRPFCVGEARIFALQIGKGWRVVCSKPFCAQGPNGDTEAEAIAAWNARAELSSEPPYDELLHCLENDWHISASWDGLRKFWCIELTEEGARLRDELNARAERTCEIEWRDESYWTDSGHEQDGAYFCTCCGKDLPHAALEAWDDYQAGIKDEKPFNYCPNCGARVRDE